MNDSLVSMLRGSALGVGLISATILVGCSSAPDMAAAGGTTSSSGGAMMMMPPPGSGAAKEFFTTKLYPLLKDCGGCHITGVQSAPVYMTGDAEGSYAKIKTDPAIFKKAADSSLPAKADHAGKALDAAGKQVASAWLDLEFPGGATMEDPGTTAPPKNGATGFNAAMQEFIRCMRQDDWEQNMKFFPMVQTQNFGPCAGCHEDGNAGTYLNADFNVTFKAMKTIPYVYRLVSPVYEGEGISDLEPNDRLITKGQITTDCFDPNNVICHDTYNIPKVQAQGLKNFQSSTISRISDLKCVEP